LSGPEKVRLSTESAIRRKVTSRAPLFEKPQLIHFGSELTDFADTAAVVSHLDLVIGSDTAVIHLASALGDPVWLLTKFSPDWRWMRNRQDNPWYPATLYRPPQIVDWQVWSSMRETTSVVRAIPSSDAKRDH
jgi:Glycosyltransferase family 9 (heptosyltransferase)